MTVLTMDYLKKEYKNYAAIKNKIQRLVKDKRLIPVKRGLYADSIDTEPGVLSAWIYGPSYVSFQYALSWYEIIPERTVAVTCATAGKNRKKVFRNSFGCFTYRDVPAAAFWYGQRLIETPDGSFWMADKEKAVCDMLNALPGQTSMKDFLDLVFDNMRMDEDEIDSLDIGIIRFYSSLYHSSNICILLKYLEKIDPKNKEKGKNMPDTKIEEMMSKYTFTSLTERKNAMKEVLQELILFALSRTDFFEKAAFYGGTALRIFYGLDRFSEDLDFRLLKPDPDFSFEAYLLVIENELAHYGFRVTAAQKKKSKRSPVLSAFNKGNTQELTLSFFPEADMNQLHRDEVIKIKFEADTMPPAGAEYEELTRMNPIQHKVLLYDQPSLFAGKLHAILCRSWKDRVKGRDLYDYLFYLRRNIPINMVNLNEKLKQSGYIQEGEELTLEGLKSHLAKRFSSIDYESAKDDVAGFLHHEKAAQLDLWNADHFKSTLYMLRDSKDA